MPEAAPTRPRSCALTAIRRSSTARIATAIAGSLLAFLASAGTASAATAFPDLDYDLGSPVTPAAQNRLDLYAPDGTVAGDRRPVVVYVHGGGWRRGDKANKISDKVNLFTEAGYVFASLNYRLSPDALSATPDPNRVMFPDHPQDVGEAIGWLDRNLDAYGGDRERIALIGHSAGAHLVSLVATDPTYVGAYGVRPWQLIGAVPLDTGAFDVAARISEVGPGGQLLYVNAFGTLAEDATTGSWGSASPITWADSDDPEQLMVTQAASPLRIDENRRMAAALGQDPDRVFLAPYDHEGINSAVGDPADTSGETAAIMGFLAEAVERAEPPKVKLKKRPPKRVETGKRRARVRFRFDAADPDASFECRLDRRAFKPCSSPRTLRARRGKHRFRVRALAANGRPGPVAGYRFTVERR